MKNIKLFSLLLAVVLVGCSAASGEWQKQYDAGISADGENVGSDDDDVIFGIPGFVR